MPRVCWGQSWCLNNQNNSVHIDLGFIASKSFQREKPLLPLEIVRTAAAPISQMGHSRLRKGKEIAP